MHDRQKLSDVVGAILERPLQKNALARGVIHPLVLHIPCSGVPCRIYGNAVLDGPADVRGRLQYRRFRILFGYNFPIIPLYGRFGFLQSDKRLVARILKALDLRLAFLPICKNARLPALPDDVVFGLFQC